MTGFCERMVKTFMIFNEYNPAGKACIIMKRAIYLAALGAVFMAAAVAYAYGDDENSTMISQDSNIKHFFYDFNANEITSSTYEDIREIMSPTFKGTYADKSKPVFTNPMIATAEFDLNGDKIPEIIARPIDTEDDGDVFCGHDLLCPNYILSVNKNKISIITVIRAMRVDRGDSIKNGYWTLKAFTKQDDPENFSHFELFSFDPKSGTYIQENAKTPEKPRQKE